MPKPMQSQSQIVDVAIIELEDGSRATLTCTKEGGTEQLIANSKQVRTTSDGKLIALDSGAELVVVGFLGTWRPS